MSCNKGKILAVLLAFIISLSCVGCTRTENGSNSENISSGGTSQVSVESLNATEMFSDKDKEVGYDETTATKINLSDNAIECNSDDVKVSEKTATITNEGTYLISGSILNGQLVIDAEKTDKIQVVLDSVNINCDTSAAIYVKQADKVFITLASGTQNVLSNKSEFVAIDDNNIDSVVFSKDDLTINGSGTLKVNAAFGHGIVSKDDLVITSGTYEIIAASHALSGNDSVRIADGNFTLSSKKDGVQAENTEDTALGFVFIAGGNFEIESEGDGISSSTVVQIEEGKFNISAGGGSKNATTKQEEMGGRPNFRGEETSSQTATTTDTVSTKGIKATGNLILNGGNVTIDSADDTLHSNANILIKDGTFALSSGDDGVHADKSVAITEGKLTVLKSYEGIEGQSIDITGGEISVLASDDGLNAAGGNDQSGFGGGMGKDNFASASDSYIKISGGTLKVNASGDGIDSNGSLSVSGGETYVSGPTNSGNGALDYNGEASITGGIFVAVGASGMAQNFGDNSTQGSILVNLSASQSTGKVVLKDSSQKELISFTPEKNYNSVLISCPQIQKGEKYTIEAGTQTTNVEMTNLIYGAGGGMGGGMGGEKGERPSGGMGQKPNEKVG